MKNNMIINMFIIGYIILMCFLVPQYQFGLAIVLIFYIIFFAWNYNATKRFDKLLRVELNDNCLKIIDKQKHIKIPVDEIQSCESIFYAYNITDNIIKYGVSISHKFFIHTKSEDFEFEFPEKTLENMFGVTLYVCCDGVFRLFDLNLPDYKCTFVGNIDYLKKEIEYYSIKHKKQSFIKRYFLYFSDLPLNLKLKNILIAISFILFLFVNIVLIVLCIIQFVKDHGMFF